MSNLVGQRLGQYEILGLLGKGGMATVYRARQTSVKREVAIKVIEPRLAETADFLKRFEKEAQTVAGLSHLHILKVFDYGQQGDLVYIVMELLDGGSLADLIRRGPLPAENASRLLDQVASALDYAHKRGILHRDLKPQNVLLDSEGNAHLTDFGIAKIIFETTGLTQSGMAMGTPPYMSPEQFQDLPLDNRADVYALGVMLFEMLTGKLPFVADTPAAMIYKHLQASPPPIRELRPDLPPGVEGVIQKALAKNRDQRFSSAGEVAAAFKAALMGQTPVAGDYTNAVPLDGVIPGAYTPAQASTPLSTAKRGQTRLLGVGAILILLGVIGISFAALSSGRGGLTATMTASATTQPTVVATKIVALPTFTQTSSGLISTVPTQSATATIKLSATLTVTPVLPTPTVPTPTVAMIALPTFTQTPSPTEPPNPATKVAATIAGRLTLTANAVASFTSTATPNEEETVAAIIGATDTAAAVALFTKTPTGTPTLTPTYTPTNTPTASPTETSTTTPTPQPVIATVNQDGVRLRAGPSVNYSQVGTAKKGDQYPVLSQTGPKDDLWYLITVSDGKFGWIYAQFVDLSPANVTIQVALTQTIPVPPPTSKASTISSTASTKAPCKEAGASCSSGAECCSGVCLNAIRWNKQYAQLCTN